MSLAKLWNTLFGKRTQPAENPSAVGKALPAAARPQVAGDQPATSPRESAPTQTRQTTQPAAADEAKPRGRSKVTRDRAAKAPTARIAMAPVAPVVPVVTSPTIRLFSRKTNAWSKLIGARTIRTVLDTVVGDGSHAVELLEAIVDSNSPAPRYVAIGLFELAGEPLSVRRFHQRVRSAGGQPVVIPTTLADGLRRVSQTVGKVDLVLLGEESQPDLDPAAARWLQRIAPPTALIVRRDATGRWQIMSPAARKAA